MKVIGDPVPQIPLSCTYTATVVEPGRVRVLHSVRLLAQFLEEGRGERRQPEQSLAAESR
jgi:hypothetical protein